MKNKIFKFKIKNLIFSCIFAIIVLILSLISNAWNPLNGLDNKISDSIYQHKSTAAKEITIVGIDDQTIEKYGMYTAVVYRQYIADILNMWKANNCIPSAIGFDIIFNYSYDCDTVDENLGDAMKKHNVILGVNGMSRTEAPYGLSKTIYEGAKSIGYVDAITDSDEAVRRTYLKSTNYNSLAYQIFSEHATNTEKA